jgi:hypothetical protein
MHWCDRCSGTTPQAIICWCADCYRSERMLLIDNDIVINDEYVDSKGYMDWSATCNLQRLRALPLKNACLQCGKVHH